MTVKGSDGITRSYDEHYSCQKDVEQDPHGALMAIQNQAAIIDAQVECILDLEKPVVEEYCRICGKPRSNHPYRHPFNGFTTQRPNLVGTGVQKGLLK